MRAVLATSAMLFSVPAGLAPAEAQQAELAVELDWQAPAGCPRAAELRSQIAEAAGGALVRGRAVVRAARRGDGKWVAVVRAAGETRELVGASCAEVAAAAGVVVGLALREPRAREAGEPEQTDDPELPGWSARERGAPEPGPEIAAALPERRETVRAARWAARAAFGADVGALASVAPFARVGLALTGRRLAARLDGGFATSTRPVTMPIGLVSSRTTLVAVGASGCLGAAGRRLWLCAGAEAGRMTAEAASRFDQDTASGLWLAAHLGPTAVWPIHRVLELVVEAEAVVPLAYPRFTVNRQPVFGSPSALGARSALGLRVLFP